MRIGQLNLATIAYSFNAQGAAVTGPSELDGTGLRGDIQYLENLGFSSNNSLTVRVERRVADGLMFLGSYTYGEALTDSVDHLSPAGPETART
jgi:hypothetical protein